MQTIEKVSPLENMVRFYGAYFDHKEAQNYAPLLMPGSRTTYREYARRQFTKYCLLNGLPSECYLQLAEEKQ